MDKQKMREEFENVWGISNESQELVFIPELDIYGCELYKNNEIAERKSMAWFYWQASREALVIELHDPGEDLGPDAWSMYGYAVQQIEAAGLKVKP